MELSENFQLLCYSKQSIGGGLWPPQILAIPPCSDGYKWSHSKILLPPLMTVTLKQSSATSRSPILIHGKLHVPSVLCDIQSLYSAPGALYTILCTWCFVHVGSPFHTYMYVTQLFLCISCVYTYVLLVHNFYPLSTGSSKGSHWDDVTSWLSCHE